MYGEIEELVSLQNIDNEIIRLKKKIKEIPVQIKKVEEEIERSEAIVEREKAKLIENQKLRKRIELDLETIKSKVKDKKTALNTVKTNKEYSTLLSEIEAFEEQYSALEDKLIEELYNAESIQDAIKESEKKRDEVKKQLLKEKDILLEHEKKAKEELEGFLKRREEITKRISKDYLELYEKTAKAKDGVALSRVVDGFCSECYIKIRPQVMVEIKKKEKIVTCENCGRILYIKEEK